MIKVLKMVKVLFIFISALEKRYGGGYNIYAYLCLLLNLTSQHYFFLTMTFKGKQINIERNAIKMKLAKKSLSVFLSILMVFSACSVGLFGVVASAAAGDASSLFKESDGEYTLAEVKALLSAAFASNTNYTTYSNGGGEFSFSGDYNMLLAADAVISYALNTYHASSYDAKVANNHMTPIAASMISALGVSGNQADFVRRLLNPGATDSLQEKYYSIALSGSTGNTTAEKLDKSFSISTSYPSKGDDVTGSSLVTWDKDVGSIKGSGSFKRQSYVSLSDAELMEYVMTFDRVEDIPKKIPTSISFSASYSPSWYAICTKKAFLSYKYSAYAWYYLTSTSSKIQTKNNTIKKTLQKFTEYFDEDILELTFNEMLELSAGDCENLLLVAEMQFANVDAANITDAVLDHFVKAESNNEYDFAAIEAYMDNLEKANKIIANKNSINTLVSGVGKNYEGWSYSQMASHYTSLKAAYDIVTAIDSYTLEYIRENYEGYGEKYDSVEASLTEIAAYIEALRLAMRDQHVKELDASMNSMIAEYGEIAADTNNLEDIDTTQLSAIYSKAKGINASLSNYDSAEQAKHITDEEQKAWDDFVAALEAKLAVRDDEAEYDSKLDYFIPYLMQDFTGMSNEELMDLHANADDHLSELKNIYTEFVRVYGEEWTNALFTFNFNGTDDLLHNHIDNNMVASDSALETYMKAVNAAQLQTIANYSGLTTVDFSNYAALKSTLSHFDDDFYTYCNEQGWVDADQAAVYATIETLLKSWKDFTASSGESAFNKNFTYADANGDYVTRYAGDQVVTEVVDGEEEEVQIGYPNDIARDNEDKNGDGKADDNYTVSADEINEAIAKLDSLIMSHDFGAIVGLKDEDDNFTDLRTYIEIMFDNLFTNELVNTLVASVFPMLTDLIGTELANALGDATPTDSNASGAIYINETFLSYINVEGTLNIYLDDDLRNGSVQQKTFPELFSALGLNIYPSTLAKSLAESNGMLYGPKSDIYKALTAAGRDWSALVDEETGTFRTAYDWGVTDMDTFRSALGAILDSIAPLLQAALGNKTYYEEATNAAYIWGDLSTLGEIGVEGDLGLNIAPLNLYKEIFVPLFETLRLDDNPNFTMPTLTGEFGGDDLVDAIFDPILELLEQIFASPITKVLDILPNLIYFLSMNTIGEILDSINIELVLTIVGIDIKSGDSGTLAKIASLLEGTILGAIDDIIPAINLALGDLLDLDEMLGFNITDLNDILQTLLGDTLALPDLDQTGIMFSSTWVNTTSANGSPRVRLDAHKADILFYLFEYILSAIEDPDFLLSLLGDKLSPEIQQVIFKVVTNVMIHPDDAVAAIMEILVPNTDSEGNPEYELNEFTWSENTWNYGEIKGANEMSIVYLNYGNDWTREDAEYIVDNIDAIVSTVLELTGSEIGDLAEYLKTEINGVFTNEVVTKLVKELGKLGDSPSAIVNDVVSNQIGINIEAWFNTFGYLYSTDTWADDAVVYTPDSKHYVNNIPDVTGVANADGSITWSYKGTEFKDGDKNAFVNVVCALLDEFGLAIDFLFGGKNISAFADLLTLYGYDSFGTTLGMLLEVLGVENIPTQADFSADGMAAFKGMLESVIDWVDNLLASDNMLKDVIEILPDLLYYIECNGLSTLLHNLLMPVLVIVDDVRPLIDVNISNVLSFILSEFVSYGEFDVNKLLGYLSGTAVISDDPDYVNVKLDIEDLRLSDLIKVADTILGTNLYATGLASIAAKGFSSGLVEADTVAGKGYKTTVDAADAITILISALVDSLAYPAQDTTKTNGDVILAFVAEKTGKDIGGAYSAIQNIINGIEHTYQTPNWGYMFGSDDIFSLELPTPSIAYLGYKTDWSKEAADGVYGALDAILDLVLPSVLDEGETLATLVDGLLNDNVYTDKNLNAIVEGLVGLLAGVDNVLLDLVGGVVDADISTWFTFCTETVDKETGETKWVCTKDWGVDAAATAAEKKTLFVDAVKQVLAPANRLLSWLFFGTEYTFFTKSETDAEGNYTYDDLITLNGGEGYAYGLVPILEALGCTMKPASDFKNEDGTYDVGAAVEGILDSVLALADTITADPVPAVFKLLPNLIYFINADGLETSVANLLAPVEGILKELTPLVGKDMSLGALLEGEIGFDISNITTATLLGIAADNNVKIRPETQAIIENFWIGDLEEFISANGSKSYRLVYTDEKTEGDMLTIVLSIALEIFQDNAKLFASDDLLGTEKYTAICTIMQGAAADFMYIDPNWGYMYTDTEEATALEQLAANGFPTRTEENSLVYLRYTNNWNRHTADFLNDNLTQLIKDITNAARDDGSSVGKLLDDAITGGLYKDSILDSLIEAVVKLIADFDSKLIGVGAVVDADLSTWFDYCEIVYAEDGSVESVTCTKDWGIDAETTNEGKKAKFIGAFVEALQPAYRLLAWLFFAEDFTFFDSSTGEVAITLTGGNGYAEALVPLLEALGCTMGADTDSGIAPASAYLNADGTYNMELAVRNVFTALVGWLSEICGELSDIVDGEGSVEVMLDKLPNVVYFINAGGVKSVVKNLLQPVDFVVGALSAFDVTVDWDTLIDGIPLTNLDFYAVFDIVEDKVGLYFPDAVQNFVATIFLGKAEAFTSANGKTAYKMVYSDTETRRDMITILLSLVLESAQDVRNEGKLSDWLGADTYKGIMDLLALTQVKDIQEFSWLFTDTADTNVEYNATQTSVRYEAAYNDIWTQDKAQYISDNLVPFVCDILGLVGLEINGVKITNLTELLDSLLEGELYTQAMADKLLDLLKSIPGLLADLEPYGYYITGVLKNAGLADLTAWDTMTVTVVDGDRDSFVAALEQMLVPIVPLLNVLLCGENIELFYELDGSNTLTIYGSEGYAYGIVPLFEALGCTMMNPDDFKALSNEDKVAAIVDALLDRVEVILLDPVNEIFAMLPEIIYFINSNGLDTAVNNILASIDTALACLAPIVGATSLMELLGVNLADYNFAYLMDLAGTAIEDSTGLDVEPLLIDFVAELTTGKVITYESANGETYYKMVYAGENQQRDMITILLRLVIDFLAQGDNAEALIALISDNAESDDAAASAGTFIKLVLTGMNVETMSSGAMATIYWIFYGLENGVDGITYLYGNYGNSWNALVDFFNTIKGSEDAPVEEKTFLEKASDLIKTIMTEFGGIDTGSSVPNCDCNCHNNSSFIRFFNKLINLIRRIFGMTEYKNCECGAAHW